MPPALLGSTNCEKAHIALSQASAIVAELEDEGVIECLTPHDDKIGKLYRIPEEGKEIITALTKERHE